MKYFNVLLLLLLLLSQSLASQNEYASRYEKSVDLGSVLFSEDKSDTHYIASVTKIAKKIKDFTKKYQKSHILLSEDISCKEHEETFSSKVEDVLLDEGINPSTISMKQFRKKGGFLSCEKSYKVSLLLYLDTLRKKRIITEVILLDGRKKNTAVVLSTAAGATVLNKPLQAATMSDNTISKPKMMTQQEVENRAGKILRASNKKQYKFILYFDKKLKLEAKSEKELKKMLSLLASLHNPYIDIVGHTDTRGSVADNYELALKRAQEIAQKIQSSGVDYLKMNIDSNSELDLAVQTADETEEALNRRVEILIQ